MPNYAINCSQSVRESSTLGANKNSINAHDFDGAVDGIPGGVFWDYVESSCDVCPPEDTGSIDACKDSCLPHLYNDCSPSAQKSNLLFGCVSTATVLKNAFVIVQVFMKLSSCVR